MLLCSVFPEPLCPPALLPEELPILLCGHGHTGVHLWPGRGSRVIGVLRGAAVPRGEWLDPAICFKNLPSKIIIAKVYGVKIWSVAGLWPLVRHKPLNTVVTTLAPRESSYKERVASACMEDGEDGRAGIWVPASSWPFLPGLGFSLQPPPMEPVTFLPTLVQSYLPQPAVTKDN